MRALDLEPTNILLRLLSRGLEELSNRLVTLSSEASPRNSATQSASRMDPCQDSSGNLESLREAYKDSRADTNLGS